MPIEPGSPWGVTVDKRDDLVRFHDERSLGRYLSERAADEHLHVILDRGRFVDLTGGPHSDSSTMRRYSCDVLDYDATGRKGRHGSTIGSISIFVQVSTFRFGHVRISNVATNNGGPVSDPSHPNDGRFDVLDAHDGLSIRDLLIFRFRHQRGLPIRHPAIQRRSVTRGEWTGRRMWASVDGARPFACSRIIVTIRPDALEIYVSSIPDRH